MKKSILLLVSSTFFLLMYAILQNSRSSTSYTRQLAQSACSASDLSGVFDASSLTAIFEGRPISMPDNLLALEEGDTAVLGIASEERWIEVDLSEQKLVAWEGESKFIETAISSGLRLTATPVGEFRIWIKLRATKMEGGQGAYYYNLPNVPYVMFFENEQVPGWRGYGLHGTYWHNDFGTPRSHGCVNLPTEIAGILYNWTSPVVPDGKWMVRANVDNPGTRIVIHE